MIKRVYGKANSVEILFSYVSGDMWQVETPASKDGAWILALYADDYAGNRAYICKILFAITGHQMKMVVIPDGYSAGKINQNEVAGIMKKLEYVSKPSERGYTLEYILCDRN